MGNNIGIYGLRKRCLYAFILFIMMVVSINVALTVWILRVLDFSVSGMGGIRITQDGIKMFQTVEFLKSLYTSNVHSTSPSGMSIESSRRIILRARNKWGDITSQVVIGGNKVTFYTDDFIIKNNDSVLYRVTKEAIQYGSRQLHVTDGASFQESLRTTKVLSTNGKSLRLASQSNNVDIVSRKGLSLKSANLNVTSANSIQLSSANGTIYLNARNIYLPSLPAYEGNNQGETKLEGIYQLCVCRDGLLFLEEPHTACGQNSEACRRD